MLFLKQIDWLSKCHFCFNTIILDCCLFGVFSDKKIELCYDSDFMFNYIYKGDDQSLILFKTKKKAMA